LSQFSPKGREGRPPGRIGQNAVWKRDGVGGGDIGMS